ncbi:MAG: CCA tRNA nucleotidyltransferase [Clostridia bacterium]|nr:CCA tRNA nucleotidyltransferase [Clostridia bacterium]MDD4387245.1 CCA tRNA nucleotidyltransferase [Clostridia bacterium]
MIDELNNNIEIAGKIAREIKEKNGTMFFVGGYVRDQIINKENKDIDVEVFGLEAEQLITILSKYGVVDQIGSNFGIFKIHGIDIDFGMPRKEKNTGVKHKDFEINIDSNMSTLEASKRRDFTMNALLQDVITGEIIDHFGGIQDIQNKIIKHIDDDTFIQDELRVLRACQFAARFDFIISEDTLKLCKKLDCTNLPKERVYNEIQKALLNTSKPSIFFEYARQIGLLEKLFAPMDKLIGVQQSPIHHPEGDVWTHTMMVIDEAAKLRDQSNYPIAFMFAAVCHDLGKITTTRHLHGKIVSYNHENELHLTKKFLKNITNDNDLNFAVMLLVKNHMRPNILVKNKSSDKAIRKLIVDTSSKIVNIQDVILLSKADRIGKNNNDLDISNIDKWWKDRITEVNENKTTINPLVTGKDLIQMGYIQDEKIGKILKKAFDLQINGLSKEEILNKIKIKE